MEWEEPTRQEEAMCWTYDHMLTYKGLDDSQYSSLSIAAECFDSRFGIACKASHCQRLVVQRHAQSYWGF